MKRSFWILLFYSLVSCHSSPYGHIPSDITQPDSMVVVLTDVHILQASIQMGYFVNDSPSVVHRAFQDIYKKHHITEDEYNKSIKFYSFHPAVMEMIYDKVLSNLSQQKAELQGKKHS